ncbi:MAG: hypothetical protein KA536_11660 [Saprospiraceae bacterium]|jgi:hypothetical protein|nr:hypothetical protein [Saprospiraceae bacterium]
MTRLVPFETKYDQIRNLEKGAFFLLVVTAISIVSIWTFEKYFDVNINSKYSNIKEILKVLSYVTMIGYLIINLIAKILIHTAEKRKRNDLIDNSFGTQYSDENTEGYYNNNDVENGLKKLAMNSYESSLHTENTLKMMVNKDLVILVIISIPFFLSIFSKGGSDIVRLLFEISIPITLLSQFIVLLVYYFNVISINERFKIEFTNIGNSDLKEKDIPKLLIPVMEYYSIKSWANTNLDSKIFKKYNDQISENWKKRKKTFE